MKYGAIVVGSGAGGGVAAGLLAEKGRKVLLLDRGTRKDHSTETSDHLANHRLSLYGHNTGPELEGNPRVVVDASGRESVVRPHENGYSNNAMALGGGTLVYGAQAWRYHPDDFRMASRYGVPKGSSLADWPIGYADLEASYKRAEWEAGVCGAEGGPMPPLPDNPQRKILGDAARRLGWDHRPVPLLINSKPYLGRPACDQCGECIGFSCHVDAKNGSQNTLITRGLASGNLEIKLGTQAAKVLIKNGRAYGIEYFAGGKLEKAEADLVIVSAGAIESARLLMLSGVENGNLGRNLQGHYYAGALGFTKEASLDCKGPGVSIASLQFVHGNDGVIGGALLANEFVPLPIIFWRNAFAPGQKRWGLEAKRFMREHYLRCVQVQGPIQEIPNPESRITLDPNVKDSLGLPVARLSGQIHPETKRTAAVIRDRAVEWLKEAGAQDIRLSTLWDGLSAGQHQAGTCRMGEDPKTSVCDAWGKVHGHENLYVLDASLHVTNGAFNPSLTIMALAFRTAEKL